jgi:hypothetical protein
LSCEHFEKAKLSTDYKSGASNATKLVQPPNAKIPIDYKSGALSFLRLEQ